MQTNASYLQLDWQAHVKGCKQTQTTCVNVNDVNKHKLLTAQSMGSCKGIQITHTDKHKLLTARLTGSWKGMLDGWQKSSRRIRSHTFRSLSERPKGALRFPVTSDAPSSLPSSTRPSSHSVHTKAPLQTHPHKLLTNWSKLLANWWHWCHSKTHLHKLLSNWCHCKHTHTNCSQTDTTANTRTQTAYKPMPLQTHPHKLLTNWYHCKHTHTNCLQTDATANTHKLLTNWYSCKHTHTNSYKLILLQTHAHELLTNWCCCKHTHTNCPQTDASPAFCSITGFINWGTTKENNCCVH